jgi:hypothetical protein
MATIINGKAPKTIILKKREAKEERGSSRKFPM